MIAPEQGQRDGSTPAVDLARLRDQFELRGKTALVAGGYGALGEAICWALAIRGASVTVSGPRAERPRRWRARSAAKACWPPPSPWTRATRRRSAVSSTASRLQAAASTSW